MLALTLVRPALSQTLANGSFATGDLAGWTASSINGGQVSVVKQGTTFSGLPGSDQIPFPNGPGSYAASVRSGVPASPQSIGILTSDPFVPRSARFSFLTLSESAKVAARVLILAANADPVQPALSDILYLADVVNSQPGTGPNAQFQRQEIDLSAEFAAKRPIRVQFRQSTTEEGTGYFTLITSVDDLGATNDTAPPAAIEDLTASGATPWSVTLSFTAPQDTGIGSTGRAAGYDVRYSLAPINEANFSAALRFTGTPVPSQAGAKETFEVTGLDQIQAYYFAVRSRDEANNPSLISNIASAITPPATPGDPGLTAQYFAYDSSLALPPDRASIFTPARLIEGATRIEPGVDINYATHRPLAVPQEYFGVRYTGRIVPKYSESYRFCTRSDDGTRLWISSQPIDPATDPPLLSRWVQQTEREFCADRPISLSAGTAYNIVLEYEQGRDSAVNRLLWSSASQPKGIVPASALVSSAILTPSPVGRITGTVLEAGGAPAAGFSVQLTPKAGVLRDLVTDGSGSFTALLPPGTYQLSGGTLTHSIPASTPPVTVTHGILTVTPPITLAPPDPLGLGIYNGSFATGDLSGWTATGINGGYVLLVQQGQSFPGNDPSDPMPFPGGEGSWVVNVRSNDGGEVDSVGILVSEPFIPNAPTLSFKTVSQSSGVAPRILLLKPSADPIQPTPDDILLMANVRTDDPGQGSDATFKSQTVDISAFYNAANPWEGTPMRLVVRQNTTEYLSGWFTLFTDFYAGPVVLFRRSKGDLDGNGVVGIGDAVLALRIVVGLVNPVDPELIQVGDVAPKKGDGTYGDGGIDVTDAIRILRHTVGLEPDPWP